MHDNYNVSVMRRFRQDETAAMAAVLKNDGVISVPTDTVYGVCARMNSEKAEQRLREVKNRPKAKSFPLMCSDLEQIRTVAETDERSEKIIRAFMPGPLTVILKKKENIPAYVNGGMDTLAIRLAPGKAVKQLIEQVGCPLFMTSANQSGQPTCTSLDEIEAQCPLLDGMMEGEVHFGEASTIVDCTGEDLVILREGPLSLEQLKQVL
jgi:L-threonylcarbamoyladenylate synthase